MATRNHRIRSIEQTVRADPAGRGLLSSIHDPLGLGELAGAAHSLANSGRHAVIVTGFYIAAAKPPAAETDGPPGAVALAVVLEKLGIGSSIVTDQYCAGAVRAAMSAGGLYGRRPRVVGSSVDFDQLLATLSPAPTHIVAIERLGRTYDIQSLAQRWGNNETRDFQKIVPPEHWSRLLNMRGIPLDQWTVDLSSTFETPPADTVTIGIGDGGNEIGMGKFRWRDLIDRLPDKSPPGILTRVACEHAIIAGTSNWGAIGLAAAVAVARDSPEAFAAITPESQQAILEGMIQNGPAVDGVTRRAEPTVDGLPTDMYLEPLRQIWSDFEIEELKNPIT